jgi:peptidoglycan/LPS O-acetylase OafA/YrhL
MVAVLTVFANHLWHWPRGGFVGVDVFFVISGFLITGNLLRTAETNGTISFRAFYWNRIRRIVPAATVVLILTYLASVLVFLPFRTNQIGVDALFAFVFASNWRFAVEGTDYFAATGQTVSPIQHFWSLSIEEQFYFVWPALIFLVSLIIIRNAWTHARRMGFAGSVMGVIVAFSLGWAVYETTESPTWAYFNTFSRVWELGIGAMLATAVGLLTRIPHPVKPLLSWAGLAVIGTSLFIITDDSVGFPAPWALMPVAGAAMVIAAGVGGEPRYQGFLRNPVSGYVGDISYSLYLVHWPVIVVLGALMDNSIYFPAAVVALAFGLTIASYHFVESPLRHAEWRNFRESLNKIRTRRYRPARSNGYAALAALTLLVVSLIAYAGRPEAYSHATPPPLAAVAPAGLEPSGSEPKIGPLASALQGEIIEALKATEWPTLDPTMESVIDGPPAPPEVRRCGVIAVPDASCTWGSPSASTRAVIVGNSIGMTYAGPLREIALNAEEQFQLHTEAVGGCYFVDALVTNGAEADVCAARKQHAIDFINTTKPDVVIISNSYSIYTVAGTGQQLTIDEWVQSMRQIIDKFRTSTKKIVFLAPPPSDVTIGECYSNRSSTPPDCVSRVTDLWHSLAAAEKGLAMSIEGIWVDSRLWFCNVNASVCPSFVGSTPTKHDKVHMSPAYGLKIWPVIEESLRGSGLF